MKSLFELEKEQRVLEKSLLSLDIQIRYRKVLQANPTLPPFPFGTKIFVVEGNREYVSTFVIQCIEYYQGALGTDEGRWRFYTKADRPYSGDNWLLLETDIQGSILYNKGFLLESDAEDLITRRKQAKEQEELERPEKERLAKIEQAKRKIQEAEEAAKFLNDITA